MDIALMDNEMRIPYVIGDEQFEILVSRMAPKYRLACELMYYCGLRVSEVTKLKWKDINFKENLIFIEKSKNLKSRYVILHPIVKGHLSPVGELTEKIVGSDRIKIYDSIKYASRNAGLSGIHPHTLRHSFATNLLNAGFTIIDVQTLLGHSSISTTQVYLHTSMDRIKKEYEEKIFKGANNGKI